MTRALLILAILTAACDAPPATEPLEDAGAVPLDAGWRDEDGGSTRLDASPDSGSDAGPTCAPGQHLCDDACVDPMPALPGNGCQRGCGPACPGGADAVCNGDGTCGIFGCEPTRCEDAAATCGSAPNGCGGSLDCGMCSPGLTCVDNACECAADPSEPNDTSETAALAGTLTDDPDSSLRIATGSIHHGADEDWYRVAVQNTGLLGDPIVSVALTGMPEGEDYDLAAWYSCSDGSAPTCTHGSPDATVASGGCRSDAVGDDTVTLDTHCDPHGVLFVRVHTFLWRGACAPYELDVSVR